MQTHKTLFPKQRESADKLLRSLIKFSAALDSSHTGVGKTVIASRIASEQGLPVAVICPKIVIPSWERELESVGVKPLFITNYEKIKRGSPHLVKFGKKMFRWQLPDQTLIIWDEVHKCAAPFSQNTQMLIAAKQAGHRNLMLSATACKDPTEMRGIGYVLGLHSLNKAEGGLPSWFTWMKEFGCRQDKWRKWVPGPVWKLEPLNKTLYHELASKLTPKDLPAAFADNHVIVEPLAFSANRDIAKFYSDAGITPEVVQRMLDGEEREEDRHALVELLRARQLAEAAKVPEMVDIITDAVAEGLSVAVFLCFSDSLKALREAIPGCAVIHGGQSAAERETDIRRFQSDACRVILSNTSAGGVGVSLHDENGVFPRMSLIMPSFNEKEHIQVLGRIHRVGAKSPATQRILVASGTVEEKVMIALERKRKSLDTLHSQP